MPEPIRLGVLTPSSNTALEPLTQAMLGGLPHASAHFSRFRVTEIALDDRALGQFDDSRMLPAAELLADAKVQAIGWSGTSAGWMGFEQDRRLCEAITQRTRVPATTAVLALNELLALRGITRVAFVTPYTGDVQQRIVDQYRALGVDVVAERHLSIRDNHSFGMVPPGQLRGMIDEVAASRPQAIVTFCTNLRAAHLAASVEGELGIPLLDTVATTVWGMLRLAGASPAPIEGWGGLFQWQ